MRVTVVGSGAAIPSARRGAPCLLLAAGGSRALLDLGSGSLHALAVLGVDARTIGLVVITHFHPDHAADLAPLLFALRSPDFPRAGTLELVGPAGLADHLAALGKLWRGKLEPRGFGVRVTECRDGTLERGGWRLSAAATGHTPESIAVGVEAGGVRVVYGGDSPPSSALASLAAGADLLILESSFPDGRPHPKHLTPGDAGRIAAAAGARRLLLTHFYPGLEGEAAAAGARATFAGDVVAAEDGLTLDVAGAPPAAGEGHGR